MGNFGPSFSGNSKNSSTIFAPNSIKIGHTSPKYVLETKINHDSDLDIAKWNVELEVAAVDDFLFATPIIYADSVVSQNGWYTRLENSKSTGEIFPISFIGVMTNKADGQKTGDFNLVATMYYYLASYQTHKIEENRKYLMRTRQTNDKGKTWSDWFVQVIKA